MMFCPSMMKMMMTIHFRKLNAQRLFAIYANVLKLYISFDPIARKVNVYVLYNCQCIV
jgi:hypothetical protein